MTSQILKIDQQDQVLWTVKTKEKITIFLQGN